MSLPPVIHVERIKRLDDEPFGEWYGEPTADSTPYAPAAALAEAEARIAALEEALRFYADPGLDGYDAVLDYGLTIDTGHIIKDGGTIARAALAESGG